MNSISYLYHLSIPSLLNETLDFLSPQQKRVLSIALLAFTCLAAAYAIFSLCRFKAEVIEEDAKDEISPPPPFYSPKDLKHEPPLDATRLYSESIVHLKRDLNTHAPIYEVPIHPLKDDFPTHHSHFDICNYNIDDRVLEFLIEYHSTKDPEIQALWNKEKNKLYIVGGKHDPAVKMPDGSFKCADRHAAWIRIDLNTLPQKEPLDICGRLPGLNVYNPETRRSKQVKGPTDAWLLTL